MYPPVFVSKPEPMTLFVGKAAVLRCALTGSPPMEVLWLKDNLSISPGGNYDMRCEKNQQHALHIRSLELADQGLYLCKASNRVGAASCSAALRVVKAPGFLRALEPVTAAAVGQPIRLECQVDEDTGVSVTWTRDGRKVHQSMDCRLSFEDRVAVLEIPKSKVKDSGRYVCRAANEAGESSCEAQVSVQGKACGRGQWAEPGKWAEPGGWSQAGAVPLHRILHELLTSVCVSVSVSPVCERHTLPEPPSFVRKMEPKLTWKQGAAARLQCSVSGSPELSVHWFCNERELGPRGRHRLGLQGGVASLELPEPLVADSGRYTCEVSNQAGSESCSSLVAVKEPPSVKRELRAVEAVRGAAATLECELAGTAPFTVSWMKNKKAVSSDQKYTIVTQESLSRLEIRSFESADVGDYQCVVSNEVGKASSKAAARLKEPPSFSKRVESQTAVLGNAVRLQASLRGSAPIAVTWTKDSEVLRDADPNLSVRFENNVASLSISAVAAGHAGTYGCRAENAAGTQACEATLVVQEPARVLEPAESVSVSAGDAATLESTVSGSPELRVKWFKDGKEVVSGRRLKLSLKEGVASLRLLAAERADAAQYSLEVSNAVGKDQCSCTLTVLDRLIPPTFTKPLKRVDGSVGQDVSLDCRVSGSAPLSVLWFRDERELEAGPGLTPSLREGAASLRLCGLTKAHSGVYTCRATNAAGSKETSASLYVRGSTPPLFFSLCTFRSDFHFHSNHSCLVAGLQSRRFSPRCPAARRRSRGRGCPCGRPSAGRRRWPCAGSWGTGRW
ncbi:titin-like isoform 1-T1 [Menidia menidia]